MSRRRVLPRSDERSRFEALTLAALLRHERAHLEGADESRARLIEARVLRELLRSAPAEYQTPGRGNV
jgi:hypothetical protein